MQVKSIAEYSKGSILQYFRPQLSYHLSLRSWFCLFFEWQFYSGFTEKPDEDVNGKISHQILMIFSDFIQSLTSKFGNNTIVVRFS